MDKSGLITHRPPRPGSYASIYLKLIAHDLDKQPRQVGWGTGFLYESKRRLYLITNWHVVTGRNPDDPAKSMWQQPDSLEFMLPLSSNKIHFIPLDLFPLYKKGQPQWLQMKSPAGRIDLVAIPFSTPKGAFVMPVNKFGGTGDIPFEPGREVVVVGYPFKLAMDNPFPLWKKAMIASEPGYLTQGKPQMFLDTPGRPGMSGSPVYFSGLGTSVSEETHALLKNAAKESLKIVDALSKENLNNSTIVLDFAGIYAGSYGDQDLERLNLGRFISANFVASLVNDPVLGENPFAPESGSHF